MPFNEPWGKGFEKDLAQYCIPTPPPGWALSGVNPTSCLGTPEGHKELARAIYKELASRNIEYAPALYHWQEKQQLIRTPGEILGPPNQGTCLDLSLLFAGICLANQLLPLIIVLDGHAFAAVCLTQNAADKTVYGRAGELVFEEVGGMAPASHKEQLHQLFHEHFLPVECTGFARWESAASDLPEAKGRSGGLLEFDDAVKVARGHLSGDRHLLFALDVEWVQRRLGGGIAALAGAARLLTTSVPAEQWSQLLDLLGRVRLADGRDGFSRAYRATLPPATRALISNMPPVLVDDLCQQSLIRAWPPLVEFVERVVLSEGVEPGLAAELRAWVDAAAAVITPPYAPREIKRLRQELLAEKARLAAPEALSWLQVCLEPDPLNRTRERKQPLFKVELVLYTPLAEGALVLQSGEFEDGNAGGADRLWTLDELPSLLDRFFARGDTVSRIPEMQRLVIEIVAPSNVLLHDFDRWRRDNSTSTYGAFRPLVVRLRDRLAIPNAAEQKLANEYWHQKWNTFRNSGFCRNCEELKWWKQEELDAMELQDDNDLACLGLSSPLAPHAPEVFDVLREAGIPIAVLLRASDAAPEPPPDWPQRLITMLEGKHLSDLCQAVQQIRRSKQARTDQAHVGNALTLLWDDPDRPPLKYGDEGVFV